MTDCEVRETLVATHERYEIAVELLRWLDTTDRTQYQIHKKLLEIRDLNAS